MEFFSKLGKKASKTYQATKEKAVNISEELKLKGKINDIKDKIDNLYIEIGKVVYNEIKDGKDVSKEEVTVKCDEISKYKDEVEKIQLEILTLKKVRKCVSCGVELDLEDNFCFKCGTKQPEIEKVEVEVKNEVSEEAKEAEVIEVNDAENLNENNVVEENTSDVVCENNEDNNVIENHEEANDEENKNNNQ